MADFLDKFDNYYLKDKLLEFASIYIYIYIYIYMFLFPVNLHMQPIENAFTVFINSSSNGREAYII
jgi:hypothetical protein